MGSAKVLYVQAAVIGKAPNPAPPQNKKKSQGDIGVWYTWYFPGMLLAWPCNDYQGLHVLYPPFR